MSIKESLRFLLKELHRDNSPYCIIDEQGAYVADIWEPDRDAFQQFPLPMEGLNIYPKMMIGVKAIQVIGVDVTGTWFKIKYQSSGKQCEGWLLTCYVCKKEDLKKLHKQDKNSKA